MLARLKALWNELPWYGKLLVLLLLPLLFVVPESSLFSLLDRIRKARVDEKAQELETKFQQATVNVDLDQAKIDELKREKEKAEQEAETDEAVDFYNHNDFSSDK